MEKINKPYVLLAKAEAEAIIMIQNAILFYEINQKQENEL